MSKGRTEAVGPPEKGESGGREHEQQAQRNGCVCSILLFPGPDGRSPWMSTQQCWANTLHLLLLLVQFPGFKYTFYQLTFLEKLDGREHSSYC